MISYIWLAQGRFARRWALSLSRGSIKDSRRVRVPQSEELLSFALQNSKKKQENLASSARPWAPAAQAPSSAELGTLFTCA